MKRRRVDSLLTGREILAAVASVAVDPHCEVCRGPARLGTDDQGHVTVAIDHEPACEHARDGQTCRSEG